MVLIHSILSSPERSSAGCFMFLMHTNLHKGGKSFVGIQLLPVRGLRAVIPLLTQRDTNLISNLDIVLDINRSNLHI